MSCHSVSFSRYYDTESSKSKYLFDGPLRSHATTTGASVFLDGTAHWQTYRFEAVIDWQQGQSLSLLTRFQDSENYVACTFSDQGVRIEERVKGEQRIVATTT